MFRYTQKMWIQCSIYHSSFWVLLYPFFLSTLQRMKHPIILLKCSTALEYSPTYLHHFITSLIFQLIGAYDSFFPPKDPKNNAKKYFWCKISKSNNLWCFRVPQHFYGCSPPPGRSHCFPSPRRKPRRRLPARRNRWSLKVPLKVPDMSRSSGISFMGYSYRFIQYYTCIYIYINIYIYTYVLSYIIYTFIYIYILNILKEYSYMTYFGQKITNNLIL